MITFYAYYSRGSKCPLGRGTGYKNEIFFSLYFCVMRYWIQGKQSERSPEETDVETFKEMVLPVFKEINWYSFQQNDKTSGL